MNRHCTDAMVFKLGIDAQKRRLRINGYAQLPNTCAFFPYEEGRPARPESRPRATDRPQAAEIQDTLLTLGS